MRFSKFIKFIFVLVIAIAIYSGIYYNSNLQAAFSETASSDKEITIPKGASIRTAAQLLKDEGLIKEPFVFRLYCKLNNKEKLIAGKYVLSTSMSVPAIVDKLIQGEAKIDTVRFTIPEGFELRQIVDKLEAEGLIKRDKFMDALKNGKYDFAFIKDIPDRENKLEGYLFPDTYEIYKGATEEEIINKMLAKFDSVYTKDYQARAKELNMTTDQVVNLAAIIEREAKLDSERKTISAVFHNRLDKGIKLQSCATVQYLLKERRDVLTYKDLEIKSPYNTYMYAGLPPGPIASPGIKSIEAALYPDKVDYLYFVAKNDGSHVFTKTYSEHLAAQNKIKNSGE